MTVKVGAYILTGAKPTVVSVESDVVCAVRVEELGDS